MNLEFLTDKENKKRIYIQKRTTEKHKHDRK